MGLVLDHHQVPDLWGDQQPCDPAFKFHYNECPQLSSNDSSSHPLLRLLWRCVFSQILAETHRQSNLARGGPIPSAWAVTRYDGQVPDPWGDQTCQRTACIAWPSDWYIHCNQADGHADLAKHQSYSMRRSTIEGNCLACIIIWLLSEPNFVVEELPKLWLTYTL